jgi:hypothetical protein
MGVNGEQTAVQIELYTVTCLGYGSYSYDGLTLPAVRS